MIWKMASPVLMLLCLVLVPTARAEMSAVVHQDSKPASQAVSVVAYTVGQDDWAPVSDVNGQTSLYAPPMCLYRYGSRSCKTPGLM